MASATFLLGKSTCVYVEALEMSLFVIVGKNEPIYEADFSTAPTKTDENAHLNQFIIHSSLDMLEKTMWTTQALNLKSIDRFNGQIVNAFLTAGSTAFILLHDGRSEDGIKAFFQDVYELYVKLMMNPFFEADKPIVSSHFDSRVRQLEKRYLR